MDYLDPEKQRQHSILLLVGYVCVTIAVVIATVILVYQAYGFGIDRSGTVIQNGVVFVSSQLKSSTIYVNGVKKDQTNARLALPADIYTLRLTRPGYIDWQRKIEVDGGSVTHFDYPFLIPKAVKTSPLANLGAVPTLSTQSPDRRWLLLNLAADPQNFQLYDLKNPTKPAEQLSLPAAAATKPAAGEQWQLAEWADDNVHVLLKHIVDGKTEFVLLNRDSPDQSVSLNQTLNADPTTITLSNKKYDQYYLYNESDHSLQTASLRTPTPAPLLSNVLAYKTYGDNQVVFVTSSDAPTGKVLLKFLDGTKTTELRSLPASGHYLVDYATYDGTPYLIAGATDEGKVYIYRDPIAQLAGKNQRVIVPLQVLRVPAADYESFSSNAQYVMVEHANQIAVYDLLNKNGYNYNLAAGLDAPQPHAIWMDGNHLSYVSHSTLQILDFDQQNQHNFVAASALATPFFAPDYKFVYTLVSTSNGASLTSTSLLSPADQ